MALRLRLALIGFGLQQFEPCPAPRPLENCGSREPGLRELNPAPFTEARSVWGGELRLTELRLEHYLVSDPRARAGGAGRRRPPGARPAGGASLGHSGWQTLLLSDSDS